MDYLDEDAVTRVLSTLLERTSDGRSVWERADQDYEFITFGNQFVYFIASRDKDDFPPFAFEVWNGNPLVVGSGSDKLQTVETTEFSPHNDKLADLYVSAKKRALRTDVVAREILSDFD